VAKKPGKHRNSIVIAGLEIQSGEVDEYFDEMSHSAFLSRSLSLKVNLLEFAEL
jgi:hypothetical protein